MVRTMTSTEELLRIFETLKYEFGKQYWWPAESKFEMMVGAILTQNVNWSNVEKAIDNLKNEDMIDPSKIKSAGLKEIQGAIKPTGFYKQKSRRLKRLANAILDNGGIEKTLDRDDLRGRLLNIKGIGPETADSIVLYAAEKPVFVIDAYTQRIMKRVFSLDMRYEELQELFENRLPKDVDLFQEYHALLVELGKNYCKKSPKCSFCPLIDRCERS